MHDSLLASVKSFKMSIGELMEVLEDQQVKETKANIEDANREIEEQARPFEELKQQRQTNPIQSPKLMPAIIIKRFHTHQQMRLTLEMKIHLLTNLGTMS